MLSFPLSRAQDEATDSRTQANLIQLNRSLGVWLLIFTAYVFLSRFQTGLSTLHIFVFLQNLLAPSCGWTLTLCCSPNPPLPWPAPPAPCCGISIRRQLSKGSSHFHHPVRLTVFIRSRESSLVG